MHTKKIFGILGLFAAVVLFTALQADSFLTAFNIENLIRRTSLFGILSIGVAFVIITGGIDLSIGSVICLVGCGLPWLVMKHGWPIGVAAPVMIAVAAASPIPVAAPVTMAPLPSSFAMAISFVAEKSWVVVAIVRDLAAEFKIDFRSGLGYSVEHRT